MKEQSRVRRIKRQNKPVRITKAKAKELGLTGQRPIIKYKRVVNLTKEESAFRQKKNIHQH